MAGALCGLLACLFAREAQAGPDPERPVVVLVHGFASAPRMWRGAEVALRAAGFDPVAVPWEPEVGMGIGETATEVLLPAIRAGLRTVGRPPDVPFHAVGHSTGGLLLRWLVEQTPEAERPAVRSLVLLSTPNHGARTGVARIACDTFRQPWRSLGCELIPGSPGLTALGGALPVGAPPTLSVGVETLPNLLPAPLYDGDGDGRAHSHDNAVMAESAWVQGATFRIWRGRRARSHFTVACSSTVLDWVVAFLRGEPVPAQRRGRQPASDLCAPTRESAGSP